MISSIVLSSPTKLRVAADWFAPVERNFAEYSGFEQRHP